MNNKWKTIEVPVEQIEGTEVNANQMSKADFDKLVSNIRKSGLSSMIACYRRTEDGKYVIISGNHRYRACLKLGYSKLTILYAEEAELTRDEIVAVQLSHNSLHGSDDKGILKRLFDEIQSVDFKEFAHINMDELEMPDIMTTSLIPVSEHFKVSLLLYRNDMDLLDELLGIVEDEARTSTVIVIANGDDNEDEFIDTVTQVKDEYDIKSVSVAFGKILELAKAQLDQQSEK